VDDIRLWIYPSDISMFFGNRAVEAACSPSLAPHLRSLTLHRAYDARDVRYKMFAALAQLSQLTQLECSSSLRVRLVELQTGFCFGWSVFLRDAGPLPSSRVQGDRRSFSFRLLDVNRRGTQLATEQVASASDWHAAAVGVTWSVGTWPMAALILCPFLCGVHSPTCVPPHPSPLQVHPIFIQLVFDAAAAAITSELSETRLPQI
jgi:hypothetical protein